MRGVYILVIAVERPVEIEVGRLCAVGFAAGTYAYVGSARGPGGIEARVGRHLRRRKKLHWHIDYLLSHPEAQVKGIYVLETEEAVECMVAKGLAEACEVIPGFGSSDCRCPGHLFRCDPLSLRTLLSELGFITLAEED